MGIPLAEILSEQNEVFITSRTQRIFGRNAISCIQGDAHDESFLIELLRSHPPFDAIVDFMSYGTEEFKTRLPLLLENTAHYLFLSSSRVYADSKAPIVETSPRLLDVTGDREYLQTDEYALAKARQEDLLEKSGRRNWTIIRPYITYYVARLQLGIFEKERWLYRALHGRTIVFPKDISEKFTTLTYGGDVSKAIAMLVNNRNAMGEKVHITAPHSIRWGDVLEIYLDVLEEINALRPPVYFTDSPDWVKEVKRDYKVESYDRLYDRRFDNAKLYALCGQPLSFLPPEEGLRRCLAEFLQSRQGFKKLHWKYEAYVDRMVGEHTALREIDGIRGKMRYLSNRYL